MKAELAGDIAGLDQKLSGRITALDEKLSGKIAELDQRLGGKIADLDKKMAVLQWMMGATLTGVAAIIVKIFFVG